MDAKAEKERKGELWLLGGKGGSVSDQLCLRL